MIGTKLKLVPLCSEFYDIYELVYWGNKTGWVVMKNKNTNKFSTFIKEKMVKTSWIDNPGGIITTLDYTHISDLMDQLDVFFSTGASLPEVNTIPVHKGYREKLFGAHNNYHACTCPRQLDLFEQKELN